MRLIYEAHATASKNETSVVWRNNDARVISPLEREMSAIADRGGGRRQTQFPIYPSQAAKPLRMRGDVDRSDRGSTLPHAPPATLTETG